MAKDCGMRRNRSFIRKEHPMRDIIDGNLFVGAILSALVGMFATAALTFFFPYLMAYTPVKIIAWAAAGTGYFLWCLHEVKVKHGGVVLFFGKRVRVGKDGKGLAEGWRWLPLPPPLMRVENVSLEQFKIDFTQTIAYTKDNVVAEISGFAMPEIDDPYDTYNVDGSVDGGKEALKGLILRWVREAAEKSDAIELIKEDKEILSNETIDQVNRELASPATNWGFKPLRLLRIDHIKIPESLENALLKKVQEPIETAYEDTQNIARARQVERLRKAGVNPNIGYPGTLVDSGKTGAEVKGFTFVGLESLGAAAEGLGKFGQGLSDAASALKGKGRKK